MQPLAELRKAYEKLRNNAKFNAEFADDLRLYVGRPSPLYPGQAPERRLGRGEDLFEARKT